MKCPSRREWRVVYKARDMRLFFMAFNLFFVSFFCAANAILAAQQNLPSKIVGDIPGAESRELSQIQVGAFSLTQNAVNAFDLLRNNGFNPVLENFRNLTRVVIKQIPANEVIVNLEKLKKLGFDEVVIMADHNSASTSVAEAPKGENNSAVKEDPLPPENKTELFSKAWRVVNRSVGGMVRDDVRSEVTIGRVYLFSANGTYMVTKTDGSVAYISQWRWVNDSREEFYVSHDNWETYGRIEIVTLNERFMKFNEGPGHFVEFFPAYE